MEKTDDVNKKNYHLLKSYDLDKIFGQSDYLDLHQLVLDYQNGIDGASDEIVLKFEEFLYKYVHFICDNAIYEDYCILRFVALFMNIPEFRRQIKSFKHIPAVNKHFHLTVEKIRFLYSRFDSVEVYQILVLTLLQMAKKYKDYSRPSFHSYVQKCFHYECYRSFNRIINDPVDRRLNNPHEFDDKDRIDKHRLDVTAYYEFQRVMNEVSHEQQLQKSTGLTFEENNVSVYDNSMFNLNWINGITCHDTFSILTPFERTILMLYYIEKKTDKEIADLYGLCRATINRKKKMAIEKIKKQG